MTIVGLATLTPLRNMRQGVPQTNGYVTAQSSLSSLFKLVT
jgi:hypothetical protein